MNPFQLRVGWLVLICPFVLAPNSFGQAEKGQQQPATSPSTTSVDREFEKHVNTDRLQMAWRDLDAAQLTEVAIDFLAAERALGRPHSKIAASDILETAVRLAVENGDDETVARIDEIADGRKDQKLAGLVRLSAGGRSATGSDWFTDVKSLTPEAFRVYISVQRQLKAALAARNTVLMKETEELVKKAVGLTVQQRRDLLQRVAAAQKVVPDDVTAPSAALQRLVGPSRTTNEDTWAAWNRLPETERASVVRAGLSDDQIRDAFAGESRSPRPRPAPATSADWTLMLYLASDCDLERAIMDNLEEALTIGSSSRIHVVVLADRHPRDDEDVTSEGTKQYTNREVANAGDWTGARVFYVEKENLRQIEDFGDVNTGNVNTLTRFLKLAVGRYPAKRYGLIMSGHGSAWQGICQDYSTDSEKDILSIVEVRRAIAESVRRPLELLAFDACLMANFEVLHSLAGTARYIAASQELSPANGWNYAAMVRTLSKSPDIRGGALGESIGEAFQDYFAKADRGELREATFSVIDMEKLAQVDASLDYVAKWLGTYIARDIDGSWQKIARAATTATEYGEAHLIDLSGFSRLVGTQFGDPRMQKGIDRLIAAISEAVIFEYHGKDLPDSHGITIYLPHRKRDQVEESFAEYAQLPLANKHSWFAFIQRATQISQAQRGGPMLDAIRTSPDDDGTQFSTQILNPDALDSVVFALARRVQRGIVILGVTDTYPADYGFVDGDDDSRLAGAWDGTWFALRMGNQDMWCPAVKDSSLEDDDEHYLTVYAEISRSGRDTWHDVELEFGYDEDEESYLLFSACLVSGGDKRQIELRRSDQIRPSVTMIGDDGEVTRVPDERHAINVTDPDLLELTDKRVPPGKYQIGFVTEDVNGETDEQFVEVTE